MLEAPRKCARKDPAASCKSTPRFSRVGASSGAFASNPEAGSAEFGGRPCLAPRTAHVWAFDVASTAERHLLRCMATLSDEEMRRASRFDRRHNREAFAVGRGTVRRIIGSYIGRPPSSISITTGEYGKPMLDPRHGLHVNWSHTDTFWLFAISSSGPVGIDIERIDPGLDWAGPAVIAYHASELTYLSEAQDPRPFLDIWTRKEAVFKGIGKGLHDSMNLTSVLGANGTPSDLLSLGEAGEWSLTPLPVPEPFVAILATSFIPAKVQFLVDRRLQSGPAGATERSCVARSQQRRVSL